MSDDLPLMGFGLPVSGSWATPRTMIRIARRAERLGYASLWTFQRILYPAEGEPESALVAASNPSARPADDPSYRAVHDALLPLAYVAGHTERIGLGTATVCAPFTPPALLAKSTTTLDHLTHGRLTVGVGMGWMPQEYVAAGVPYERRGARMEEYLRCLEALWTQDPVEFDGEFYTVPRSRTGPRPVQLPHPPLLVGGAAPAALRRAGRLAQGWICSSSGDPARISESVEQVRDGVREAGRDPQQVRVLFRAVVELVDEDPGPGRRPFHGTREQVLHEISRLRAQGVTEVLVDLNFSPKVGSPDVDADDATAEAERVMDALAPQTGQLRQPPPSA
jgi:probable F420-dependent oxidoreductase